MLFHSDYGWCGPPTCLSNARASVESGTPPRFNYVLPATVCQHGKGAEGQPGNPAQNKGPLIFSPRLEMPVDMPGFGVRIKGAQGGARSRVFAVEHHTIKPEIRCRP